MFRHRVFFEFSLPLGRGDITLLRLESPGLVPRAVAISISSICSGSSTTSAATICSGSSDLGDEGGRVISTSRAIHDGVSSLSSPCGFSGEDLNGFSCQYDAGGVGVRIYVYGLANGGVEKSFVGDRDGLLDLSEFESMLSTLRFIIARSIVYLDQTVVSSSSPLCGVPLLGPARCFPLYSLATDSKQSLDCENGSTSVKVNRTRGAWKVKGFSASELGSVPHSNLQLQPQSDDSFHTTALV